MGGVSGAATGVGGGGAARPVTLLALLDTISGLSVFTVAEISVPFLSWKTVFFLPSTSNVAPDGTLYSLLVPSGRVRMTFFGAFTYQTFPEIFRTVFTVYG